MHSLRLIPSLEAIIQATTRCPTIRTLTAAASKYYDNVVHHLGATIDGGQPAIARAKSVLAQARTEFRKLKAAKVIIELAQLRTELESATNIIAGEGNRMIEAVVELLEAYDVFVADYSYAGTLRLVRAGRHFEDTANALVAFSTSLIATLQQEPLPPAEGESALDIVLFASPNFRVLIDKLQAIQRLYEETAALMGVAIEDYPLRLGRIESGSLWVKVFGETNVIRFLTESIERTVAFLHRNFTTEGKIASIPRKVAALDTLLELSTRLRNAGIETQELEDNLARSAAIISQELTTLLAGEAAIEINGRQHSLNPSLHGRYLAAGRKLLRSGVTETN